MRRFKSHAFLLFIALFISQILFANGSITGMVLDKETLEALPFTNIILELNDIQVSGAQTDFDGKFKITGLKSGSYTVKASFVGYNPMVLTDIEVKSNEEKKIILELAPSSIMLQDVVITSYKTKLIDKGNTAVKSTVGAEDYSNMRVRSASEVVKSTAGVYSSGDESKNLNIRGARSDANYYYIDGMKVIGSSNLPKSAHNGYTKKRNKKSKKQYQVKPQTQADAYGENYAMIQDNTFLKVANEPLSTFSVDVDKASYTNVRRFLTQGYLPPKNAVRIEEMVNYFKYDYPQPDSEHPFSIQTEYTDCPWNANHKLVHIGIQGKEIEMETAPPNNLVFLLDVSGSMSAQNKLGLVKIGLNLLIDQMRPEDQVAIVVYAGAAGVVLPSTSGKDKEKIKDALNRLQAGGSTAGGQGIELAYNIAEKNFIKDGNNRIILASDGDFNVGISSTEGLKQFIATKRDKNIFLTTLGFGSGNINDANMEQLANKGNGNYNYIDNALEARKVFVSEMGSNLITIAKDVKVQVEFNPNIVKGYKLIGYVNRKLENEDFNDDKKDAGEIGSGHSVTMMYEIIPANSEELVDNIDPLKYQKEKEVILGNTDEVLTVKFRYKQPTGDKSVLITHVLQNKSVPFEYASTNCQFSSSVASFGMLLRGRMDNEDYGYKQVMKLAKANTGQDSDGTRKEFVNLVELASSY